MQWEGPNTKYNYNVVEHKNKIRWNTNKKQKREYTLRINNQICGILIYFVR